MSAKKKTPEQTQDLQDEAATDAVDSPLESGPESDLDPFQMQQELLAAKMELTEQQDQFMRAKAEVENIRRRAENEVANARRFAVEEFAAETLAVRDSLELARDVEISSEDSGALEKMREGLDLTLRQLDAVFNKFGIRVVSPDPGDKLDPEQHQAMSVQESAEIEPNHIVSVVQRGYLINQRLLRPAMVIVARAVSAAASPEEAEKA